MSPSHSTEEDPKAQRGHSPALAWSTPSPRPTPAPCTGILDGENESPPPPHCRLLHRPPGAHPLPPPCAGPLEGLPPRMTWSYAVVASFPRSPLAPRAQPVVRLWGHPGASSLGPRCTAVPVQLTGHLPVSHPPLLVLVYISTCLWGDFKYIEISSLLLHKMPPYKVYVL